MRMTDGFDPAIFRRSLLRNLATVGALCFGSMALVMFFRVFIGMFGVISGELGVLHLLAMLGMAAGFGALTALCSAVVEGYGSKVFNN